MFRSTIKVQTKYVARRFQSTIQHQGTSATGLHVSTESLGDVKDMSVHGLCINSVKLFFYGLVSGSKSDMIVPALGR